MSTLATLYQARGPAVFDALHRATGADPKYLYQIATGRRKPSAALARRLVEAEPLLSLEGLLFPDVAAAPGQTTPPVEATNAG